MMQWNAPMRRGHRQDGVMLMTGSADEQKVLEEVMSVGGVRIDKVKLHHLSQ